jgi:hypothetical protein
MRHAAEQSGAGAEALSAALSPFLLPSPPQDADLAVPPPAPAARADLAAIVLGAPWLAPAMLADVRAVSPNTSCTGSAQTVGQVRASDRSSQSEHCATPCKMVPFGLLGCVKQNDGAALPAAAPPNV